jgi:AcrR family transcriptional regulator
MTDQGSSHDERSDWETVEQERIVAAFGRAAADSGSRRISLDAVAAYAGLPRERVEAHFPDVEAGLLAVQQAFLGRLRREAAEACASCSDWSSRVKASVTRLLSVLAETDELARVLAVEVVGISAGAAERRFGLLDELALHLAKGRTSAPVAAELPPSLEQLLVDGAASVVARRLLAADPAGLLALGPELVELILWPYLGGAEARRVAQAED